MSLLLFMLPPKVNQAKSLFLLIFIIVISFMDQEDLLVGFLLKLNKFMEVNVKILAQTISEYLKALFIGCDKIKEK